MKNIATFRIAGFLAATLLASAWAAPFTDNGDGTVTDAATSLVWDRCAWDQTGAGCSGNPTPLTWAQALAAAQAANAGSHKGHSDWRLPNIKELESLVRIDGAVGPYVDAVFSNHPPPGSPSVTFWSSTHLAHSSVAAFYVGFGSGSVGYGAKFVSLGVRLVRGGQSLAAFDALGDTTAPALAAAPTIVPGADGATAGASLAATEDAAGYWQVLPAGTAAPAAAALLASGAPITLTANALAAIPIAGLAPGSAYVFHFIARDAAGNASGVFSTPFAVPSALASIPTLSEWTLVLLAVLMAALGLRGLRSRGAQIPARP
ncbi:IPTL-CTERM sorting domain-containing protein [Acidovorax sp. SDU_ACID1]|uniref:IPTL-CTERM sorting domain-containing protein n=1 Tax=Acidovorax sp. SDU_ACID1 TaxID=3136632 RepID=UPI003872FB3B